MIVLLAVLIIYNLYTKQITIKQIIVFGLSIFILALPLLLMVGYNSGIISKANLPFGTIPELWWYRGTEFSFENIKENIHEIYNILFVKDILGYNSIEKYGTLYRVSMPIVVLGITFSICDLFQKIKKREKSMELPMLTIFFSTFFILLTIIEPNINKANALFIPMMYFITKAISFIGNRFKVVYIVSIIVYMICYISFIRYYFCEYSKQGNYLFEQDIIDATKFAETLDKDSVYVENCLNQTYIYTLLANTTDVQEFANSVKIEYYTITKYSNYQFYYDNTNDIEGVYLLKTDQNKYDSLKENGYKDKVFGDFHVLYYEND